MANVKKWIGLSLGADICWPICYEEIARQLQPRIPQGDDTVEIAVERLTIEPFHMRQPCKYTVVLDRLTHWYNLSREWIKKAILMDDLYVLNNPWAVQSMEKATSYAAMIHLGLPVPETWMVPPKAYEESPDLERTLSQYAKLFDLGKIGEELGYPLFMKPYDGGAWVAVDKIDDEAALRAAYDKSGKRVMHLQKAVLPFDLFVRSLGVGPQVRTMKYDPSAPLHDRYCLETPSISPEEARTLRHMTLTINTFFGWDFNSCESLRKDGVFHPIDFANACPDSQVTSLHYHFPWLIKAILRWSIFCAVTDRPMHRTPNWDPYYAVQKRGLPFPEALEEYGKIAEERLETERFVEFCATHLKDLDEVAFDFFGTPLAKDAVRQKVTALFPEHEIEQFTELFWQRIQDWREKEGSRPEVIV